MESATEFTVPSTIEVPRLGVIADLVSLTKPKIITLLLISTCCPMVLASAGRVPLSLVLWTLLGGALTSASASVINCIWDRDIDAVMERTKERPLAARRISVLFSLVYALFLGFAGLLVLEVFANRAAAIWALIGHLFYVFVYTIWLKRTTSQNIVIGGAAGAIPPLVGWAAVTGGVDLTALLLFSIVFFWTPPHFWALALNKNSDYSRAGVPMLPVVAGPRTTHYQMLWYAVALIPLSIALVISSPSLGYVSLVCMVSLSLVFAWKVFKLTRIPLHLTEVHSKQAWSVFGFSLIYLALFFVCIVVDSAIV